MKKLTYDQIKKIYNEKLKEAKIHIHHDTPDGKAVYLMLETFVDSINECIEPESGYKGKIVKFKEDGAFNTIGVSKDQSALCLNDHGENLIVETCDYVHNVPKKSVYLIEEQ